MNINFKNQENNISVNRSKLIISLKNIFFEKYLNKLFVFFSYFSIFSFY